MSAIDSLYQLERRMLTWCVRFRYRPVMMQCIRWISRSGDGYVQVFVPLLYLWLVPSDAAFHFAMLIALSFFVERVLYFSLKNTLKRKRPPEIWPDFTSFIKASDQFSFPSGHTMASFLMAGLCVQEFGMIAWPLFIWAISVGASRVFLGVHFPTDILAGALLGCVVAVGIFQLWL